MPDYLGYIKKKEGFREYAYEDADQYSIGYGTRTEDPYEIAGLVSISETEAHDRLVEWTNKDREKIVEMGAENGLEWEDNELDALTSFTYNLGSGNLSKLITGRGKGEIAEAISLYNKADGEVIEGLSKRREEEAAMFTNPPVTETVEVQNEKVADEFIMPEPDEKADRAFLDYQEPNIPMSVLRATPSEVGSPSAGELWDASVERNWITSAMTKQIGVESELLQSDYSVKMEDLQKYNEKGYKDEELGFLAEATSPENFAHRLDRIDQDREVKQLIEQGGMKGTGMEMLASVTDPLLIPSFFLGGAGAAAKWNSFKAIGMSMLSGGSQNLAVEYLLKQGDTQRTDEDLMFAVAAGSLFSGAITTAGLGVKAARSKLSVANEINAAGKDEVHSAMHGVVYDKVDQALSTKVSDPVQRKTFLTEKDIISKLQEEAGTKVDTISSKKIKEAKTDFKAYKKSQVAKIEAMKASKIKPSSRNKQVAEMERALSETEAKLTQTIKDNSANISLNSDLDKLADGKVPDSLMERYKELKAEAGEFDAVRKEFNKEEFPKPKPKELDESGEQLPEDKSVGAMQVKSQYEDIKTNDNLLVESDVDEIYEAVISASDLGQATPRISRLASKAIGFRSTSTQVDQAPDSATRGMGIQLLKNGTRTIKGHQSAEELAETLFFRNVPDYLTQERAFDEYAAANGVGILGKGRDALKQEFDKLVVLEQASGKVKSNAVKEGDSPIIVAAKARARIYERSLGNNKDYDVVGFKNVEHDNSYHSVVYSADNILSIDAHADEIYNTIAKAYENGGIKLSRENAVRLAQTQVERVFSYRHGDNGTFKTAMSDAEYKLLDKELAEKGLDATTRAELKSSLFNKEDLAQMSPRAMFSLKPDLTVKSGNVRMVDIIDTSMDRVMKYASDSSANAGLASHGYKSRNQFLRALEEARSQSISDLKFAANTSVGKAKEEAQRQLAIAEKGANHKLMDDALKLMYREPLDSAGSDKLHDISKILRKQTSITRLRSTGLMALPENAIAMARNGALNTIRNMPKARYFDLRSRSIEQDKFMNDFARTFSATGHQEYLFGAKFYNNSDFDDATKGKLSNMINKLQGKAMNVTMTVNAFRSFQHGGEEMVARSIVSNLKELAVKGEITPNVRKSLIDVGGLDDSQVNQMIKHFKERPDLDVFDSVRQMEPKLYNAVSTAARNTIGSSFMRMGIGESVPYANRELGKIVTSLLNFTIGSWEKMVVRGIKSDGPALMAAMFAGQSALALMSQYAYVHSRAAGMEGTERDKYIEKSLSDEGLFWGTFNRVGFLAAPALPLQMLSAARLLPEEIEASPTKAGISEAGIPSVGMANDILKASGSAGNLISDKFNYEYMSDKDRERNWKNIRRVLPWIDSPVYNFTLGQVD